MSSVSETVRKMLSEYSFEVDNPDLTCILCEKIMIDAYQSSCGCNYCQSCITNYLSGEKKYCVGKKEECKEEYLILDKNIIINPRINRLILKTNIRCPYQSCLFETDLCQMEKHLSECTVRSISCPFSNMGCSKEGRSKNEIVNHLHKEEWIHADMLSEFVENTKHEIISLREESKRRETQMKDIFDEILILKESLNKKEDIIKDQRKDLEAIKDELQKEKENNVLMVEIRRQLQDQGVQLDMLKNEKRRKKNELEMMRKELGRMRETQNKTLMEEVENVKKVIEKMDVREEMDDQKKSMSDLRENQENIEREISSIIKKVKDFRIYDEKEFMWRVDNFLNMKDGRCKGVILWRYCIKFYLRVWCDEDNFGFTCNIMKGEFDNYLVWPMKHKIRLALINQDTMEVHQCKEYRYDNFVKYKYAFNQSTSKWNEYYFGNTRFATVKDIKDSPGVLSQDSLLLLFIVDYQ